MERERREFILNGVSDYKTNDMTTLLLFVLRLELTVGQGSRLLHRVRFHRAEGIHKDHTYLPRQKHGLDCSQGIRTPERLR